MSLFSSEIVVDKCFDQDIVAMERGKGQAGLLSNFGFRGDPQGAAKLEQGTARWTWCALLALCIALTRPSVVNLWQYNSTTGSTVYLAPSAC